MNDWIDITKEQPRDQQECIIAVPSWNLHTKIKRVDVFHANYWKEDENFSSCEEGDFDKREVTHWMPMPEPPEDRA